MTGTRVASALESRYRRLLVCYPEEWRTRNEEVVLGVLLDRAEAGGRTTPTVRETLDITVRGLASRAAGAAASDVRSRVAGIGAGLGLGFAVVYFAVFIGPSGWGDFVPATHAGPAAMLLAWLVVAVTVVHRGAARWQRAAVAVAVLLPILLWQTRPVIDVGHVLVISGWARPSDATAVFVAGLGLLAALGPIDRRLMLRTAGIAAMAFAVGFWVTGGWADPYDQALWGSPSQSASGAPGTLQMLWGSGSGRMPVASDRPSFDWLLRGRLQATVLRLKLLPLATVLGAIVVAGVLALRGRSRLGAVVLIVVIPFLAALLTCAAQPNGVWFQ